MANVRSGAQAQLWVVDEASPTPNEMQVYPMEASVSFSIQKAINEFKHRGTSIPNGEGVLPAQQALVQLPVAVALKDLEDDENLHTLFRWMMADDANATAITGGTWESTTDPGLDGYRTLNLRYYPGGKASGRAYYEFPNMRIIGWEIGESLEEATILTVTFQSVDAYEPTFSPGT